MDISAVLTSFQFLLDISLHIFPGHPIRQIGFGFIFPRKRTYIFFLYLFLYIFYLLNITLFYHIFNYCFVKMLH